MVGARTICLMLALVAALPLAAEPEPSTAPTLGLIAAETPEITAALTAGARLALAQWEDRVGTRWELVVSEPPGSWSAASGPAVELAFATGVVALLTPPDRATAHLLAQLGSRAQLPVVSTAEAESVTAAGSYWVVSVAPGDAAGAEFRRAFRRAEGRDPDAWAVLGYDAAAAVAAAVQEVGLDHRAVVEAWRRDLRVEGAGGLFSFDAAGRRRR